MRYYSHHEYDENGGHIETFSEDEIRKEYYPYWYGKMCEKYGKEHVDAIYGFEECLEDWCTLHWAWEVTE